MLAARVGNFTASLPSACNIHGNHYQKYTCTIYREIFPGFIFALFALRPEGELKTGLIELYIKDFIRKLKSGRIQD